MRYVPDHKAQTRDRVLKAAAASLRVDGPDRVGVASVMAAAGLTHGGFYAHFSSRDDLLSAAVGSMFDDKSARFFADVASVDPRSGLRRFVDRYLSMRHRDSREEGCPIPILAGELHRLPDAARTRFAAAVDRMIDNVATLLDRAGAEGPQPTAVSAIAEMVGAVALARVMPNRDQAATLLATARASVNRKLGLE